MCVFVLTYLYYRESERKRERVCGRGGGCVCIDKLVLQREREHAYIDRNPIHVIDKNRNVIQNMD